MRVFPAFPTVTPPAAGSGRDLALDVVRSWSLLVVVLGHFLMQIQFWPAGGIPVASNTLSSGDPWPYATWLFQVMPLFFVAGGAVNAGSWERNTATWSSWTWSRIVRLMRPTVVFLAVCAVLFTAVTFLVRREVTDVLVAGVTGPLWFLAVYIPVTALTPWTLRWFDRAPLGSCLVLFGAVVLVDVVRLNLAEPVGAVNLLVAWAGVHQLGYWYRRGVSSRVAAALVVAGLGVNLVLIAGIGWYPTSLVGIPTEEFSNMAPPTVVLASHSIVLFGLFVLSAPALRRWCARPRAFTATVRAGLLAMTVYLWHMLVMVGWIVVLHHLGWDLPVRFEPNDLGGLLVVPDGLGYWGWLLLSALGYGLLVWCVGRWLWPIEFLRLPGLDTPVRRNRGGAAATAVGLVLLAPGILATAGIGFSGFPFAVRPSYGFHLYAPATLCAVVAGLALTRLAGASTRAPTTHRAPSP